MIDDVGYLVTPSSASPFNKLEDEASSTPAIISMQVEVVSLKWILDNQMEYRKMQSAFDENICL